MAAMHATLSGHSAFDFGRLIEDEVLQVARERLGEDLDDALVRPSPHDQEGDYQSTLALRFGRDLGVNPRELADEIAGKLGSSSLYEPPTVTGPGFINFRLLTDPLVKGVREISADARLAVPTVGTRRRIVIDYSAPNVAKEMHVGHLRSTIIGDALRRMLAFYGHELISQNHLGDWGTPFGMLIEQMLDESDGRGSSEVDDLTRFYQDARQKFEQDAAFTERSRLRVVKLQQGDEESLDVWRRLREISERYFQEIYDTLGVGLTPEDNVGESFYNPWLASVVDELGARGLLTESEGAQCIFLDGFTTREGTSMPIIVKKRDGGFNYDTTDLAALRYRLKDLGAEVILYVVGAPQALHFQMLFAAAMAAGWTTDETDLRHIAFGSVLGEDGKMLRTRAGKTVRLTDLLDEAIARATALLDQRGMATDDRDRTARAVGIGAVKYADLSSDRMRDYVFAFDRMLSFEGNTAAYLQYANARARSLLRKHGDPLRKADLPPVALETPEERALALQLLAFGTELSVATELLQPYKLCIYLHDLAARFSSFYEACPIGTADEPTKTSRLLLASAVSRTVETGLELLGIEAPERL